MILSAYMINPVLAQNPGSIGLVVVPSFYYGRMVLLQPSNWQHHAFGGDLGRGIALFSSGHHSPTVSPLGADLYWDEKKKAVATFTLGVLEHRRAVAVVSHSVMENRAGLKVFLPWRARPKIG